MCGSDGSRTWTARKNEGSPDLPLRPTSRIEACLLFVDRGVTAYVRARFPARTPRDRAGDSAQEEAGERPRILLQRSER